MLEEENGQLRTRVTEMESERDVLHRDFATLLADRKADRELRATYAGPPNASQAPLPSDTADTLQLLDLARTHIEILTSHHEHTSENHLTSISSLSHDLTRALSSLSTARTALEDLQARTSTASADLEEARLVHANCADQIFEWRTEASRASAQECRLKSELCDVRVKLEELEVRTAEEREMLRRANEGTARWGAAKIALEDEVQM
jgi:chromosome segregation ATPase